MSEVKGGTNWPMFIVGCVLLAAALGMAFWAFDTGTLTPDQRLIVLWILPLASGFGSGAFAGGLTLQARGALPGLLITATGGFGVWLLTYWLLPIPHADSPSGRARELLERGQQHFAIALQDSSKTAFSLSHAIPFFEQAAAEFAEIPGSEFQHVTALAALAVSYEKLSYEGAVNGRLYWIDGDDIVWAEARSGNTIAEAPRTLQRGLIRCTDVVYRPLWIDAAAAYLSMLEELRQPVHNPSSHLPVDLAKHARSAGYFFICDCLRMGAESLPRAIQALRYAQELTSFRHLDIGERYEDAAAKLEFIEGIGGRACEQLDSTLRRVSTMEPALQEGLTIQRDLVPYHDKLDGRDTGTHDSVVIHSTGTMELEQVRQASRSR